jgi:hypothetical protein
MRLTDLLKQDANAAYDTTAGLFKLVDASKLSWKPPTGKNWMTLGQVVQHCTNSCGSGVKGFVSGDWDLPDGTNMEDLPPDQMLPPAEKLPTASSIDAALKELEADRATCMEYLEKAGEESLLSKKSAAPWGGPEMTLFQHCNSMIGHLAQHKAQLFYYLKMLDKDVNTQHLWGM